MKSDWISYIAQNSFDGKHGKPAPYFRKEFVRKGNVKKAILKFACLGWIKVYLNGKEITKDEEFLVSWTDYTKRIEYLTYDVTENIANNNAIGVILGNGWACGSMVFKNLKPYYGIYFPCFTLELSLLYEDGTFDIIKSDKSWKANTGAILYNDIMYGEYIDSRLEHLGFSKYGFDDSKWFVPIKRENYNNLLVREQVERTKVNLRLKTKLLCNKDGVLIYTTEQNFAGIIECKLHGDCGSKVVFKYGEMLDEQGFVYQKNLRTAESIDTYICSGKGEEIFRPKFTFHGFQFIQVEITGNAYIDDIEGLVVYSSLKRSGEFHCDNDLINKIYSNALWGQRSNFINVPTDCPQRDERLGWTADTHIFSYSAMFNMDCRKFYKKYIVDMCDAQTSDGCIPPIAPNARGFLCDANNSSAWSDAIIILPYNYYIFYRDVNILQNNIKAMKRYLSSVENMIVEGRRQTYCYGDWLSIEDTDNLVFDYLFQIYDYLLMYKICKIISDDDAEIFENKYLSLKKEFREKFVDKNYKILSDTQTVYLLAYNFGVLSKEEIKFNLLRKLSENNFHLSSGFIGTKYLLPTLCDIGETALAYKIINTKTYPSWGFSIVNGATTIWERWDSFTKEKGFGNEGMNSFNHYSLGSCSEWFFRYVLGIDIDSSSKEKISLKPYIDYTGVVKNACGSFDGLFGKVKVSWIVDKENATYSIEKEKSVFIDIHFNCFDIVEVKEKDNCIIYYLKRQ